MGIFDMEYTGAFAPWTGAFVTGIDVSMTRIDALAPGIDMLGRCGTLSADCPLGVLDGRGCMYDIVRRNQFFALQEKTFSLSYLACKYSVLIHPRLVEYEHRTRPMQDPRRNCVGLALVQYQAVGAAVCA